MNEPINGDWYAAKDIDKMVRELDVAMNGDGAAPQAKLCDLVQPLLELIAESRSKQEQAHPVAWIEHEWSGTGLRKLHFERHDPTVRDEVVNPIWTPLYTIPKKRKPITSTNQPYGWFYKGHFHHHDPSDWADQNFPIIELYSYQKQNKQLTSEEIADLRNKHGITSDGRGIKEFTQVVDFVREVEAHGIAPQVSDPKPSA